ncbi:MAG: autotransporter-associated beta strand repeat-containing protein [Tepidisphaeraceae bacterium]|jgi:autotransporter-associated beta strand protein
MFVGFWRRAAFGAAVMLYSSMAPATSIWTGSSGIDNNWNTGTNWSGGSPGANADVVFPVASVTASNNNISSLQLNSLTFTGSNYALTGNALTLGSTTSGSGFISVNANAANNSAVFDIALAGAAGNTQFFTVNTGAALTLSGQLSGSTGVALTKEGSGTLILTGDNSGFTGPFTLASSGGIVQTQNASALGASTLTATVGVNSQLQLDNVAGTIAKNLSLNGAGPTGNGALLNLAGTNTLAGDITLDSDTTIGATAGAMTLNGLISDSGAGHNLTITGNGVIDLGSAGGNTYRGSTSINGGVLAIANTSGSATGTGNVVINSGGTLRGNGAVSGQVVLNSGGVLDPGLISGGGMGTGAATWNGGGALAIQLGADGPGSDQLDVNGSLLKGTAGTFQFSFDAVGAMPGNVYDLIQFASTTFAPGDFSFVSSNPLLAGNFSFDSPTMPAELLFTVTAVPEPATGAVVVAIAVVSFSRRWKRSCRSSSIQ